MDLNTRPYKEAIAAMEVGTEAMEVVDMEAGSAANVRPAAFHPNRVRTVPSER